MTAKMQKFFPGVFGGVALIAYVGGIFWRFYYLFSLHPITDYLYSDMKGYADAAMRFSVPGYRLSIIDAFYPPGMEFFFGLVLRFTHSWQAVTAVQFIFSALIPLVIYFIALKIYGRNQAWLALLLASVYYPFTEVASFFLAENAHMLFLYLGVLLLLLALSLAPARKHLLPYLALAAGVSFGIALAFRSAMLISVLLIFMFLFARALFRQNLRILKISLIGFAGVLLIISGASLWCARGNEGNFCLISNNGALGFLQGHYGRTLGFNFHDQKRNLYYVFGSPASVQKGFQEQAHFPFGAYESNRQIAAAAEWIKNNPADALLFSFEHIRDLFAGNTPWPSSHTKFHRWMEISELLFVFGAILPAGAYLVYLIAKNGLKNLLLSDEAMLALPILGMILTVFLTIGETRYRIPLDGFFIIIAAQAYVLASRKLFLAARKLFPRHN